MPEFFSLYAPFLIGTLLLLVAILLGLMINMEMRLRRFMRGQNAASLEDTLKHVVKEHAQMLESDSKLSKTSADLRKLLTDSIRGVSVVRFNALSGDSSGKQSFAVALLSEKGNGVVISSMYTRDNARMYAKSVQNFSSEHELTEEEKKAIVEARKGCSAT